MFDLAGSVDGFLRATEGIPGLEFLAELQEAATAPDPEFFYEAEGEVTDKAVPESLYMVMTNAQAVAELVRLFELWRTDRTVPFPRGVAPLRKVFDLLRAVRRWGPSDRVRETGLLETWQEDVEVNGAQGYARIEIDLWYRNSPEDRAEAASAVSTAVTNAGGDIIAESDHPGIAYHGLLATIPYSAVEQVLEQGLGAIELLTSEQVMLVGPSLPMSVESSEVADEEHSVVAEWPDRDRPVVALLDGMPIANHAALVNRLIVDDPDDVAREYPARSRSHGTAMASLIAHGDLMSPGVPLRSPIYVRPILQPDPMFPDRQEITLVDELLVDVVHRAFRRMFEGDGASDPVAPSVRVVNLSIGDPARAFARRMSPIARLVDWLAHKYNVVVVISAGNHRDVEITVARESLEASDDLVLAALKSFHEQARHRRLLAPAEAINVLTVGALHEDQCDIELPSAIVDPLDLGLPAGYSAVGLGFRRSVKPDVLFPGGRQLYLRPVDQDSEDVVLKGHASLAAGPGILTAAPGETGELGATAFTFGTSNAAALATRTVAGILDALGTLEAGEGEYLFPNEQYHPVLARALLVHAADWHDLKPRLSEALDLTGRERRAELTRILGFGPVHIDRVASAERTRVVLMGAGSIQKDVRHSYRFPLPRSLAAVTDWRRLTITLGWFSPLNVRSQKYRLARLNFQAPRDRIGVEPTEADGNAVKRGTMRHEILEGSRAVAYSDGDFLSIDVDCFADAGTRIDSSVRYGLVASLEIGITSEVDLHSEVRTAIRSQARQRVEP